MKGKCPLESTTPCETRRCIYKRRADGECCYSDLVGGQDLDTVCRVLGVQDVEKASRIARRNSRRIAVALVADAYFSACDETVNNGEDRQTCELHVLFGVGEAALSKVLHKDKYERWARTASTDVTFEELIAMFSPKP